MYGEIRRAYRGAAFYRAADFYGSADPGSGLGKLAGGIVVLSGRAQEGEPPDTGAARTPAERTQLVGRVAFADSTLGLIFLLFVVVYFGGRLVRR